MYVPTSCPLKRTVKTGVHGCSRLSGRWLGKFWVGFLHQNQNVFSELIILALYLTASFTRFEIIGHLKQVHSGFQKKITGSLEISGENSTFIGEFWWKWSIQCNLLQLSRDSEKFVDFSRFQLALTFLHRMFPCELEKK